MLVGLTSIIEHTNIEDMNYKKIHFALYLLIFCCVYFLKYVNKFQIEMIPISMNPF
ncbi:hypothetical protein FVB9288_03108 [Flavobacterium sp. CECT 9288]|nr:hypothetical protein FVB9288_03108 [Flavobacterium sp. CECT 9288]